MHFIGYPDGLGDITRLVQIHSLFGKSGLCVTLRFKYFGTIKIWHSLCYMASRNIINSD